jgi:hypothetical protein
MRHLFCLALILFVTRTGFADDSRLCRLQSVPDGWSGSCGPVFDGTPVFTISRAAIVTSGVWSRQRRPLQVWSGTMNADRIRSVELEIYAGGGGVIRTEFGWFPVLAFQESPLGMEFRFDAAHEVPPNELDRLIVQRAASLLSRDTVWNRKDDRNCPRGASTWSIYCAMERATRDISGGFHHRRPAMELVRQIVEERTAGRDYSHRLMDYNNDRATALADVNGLFGEALQRISKNGM